MAPAPLRILGIPGSLRERSYNRALLRACVELQPPKVEIVPFDLRPIPSFDGDLENDEDRPEPVCELKRELEASDGLLIVTPEYNHGIPGVLKNALDWASRPAFRSPMAGLPVGIMGASPGGGGTALAQQSLKLVLLGMISEVFPHPGVRVARCKEKFDDELTLSDQDTRDFVGGYLEDFAERIRTTS